MANSQSITDLIGLLTESNRIITSHSRHFLTLSVLFILPLSFSLTVFPTLFHTFTSPTPYHIQSLLRFSNSKISPNFHNPNFNFSQTLIFSILFFSFTIFFAILAISSVTSSVYRGFYGRPVKLLTSFVSVFESCLSLLITFVIVFVVFAIFGFFGFLGIRGIQLTLGVEDNSTYFIPIYLIGGVILGLGLIQICVDCTLASVIVVVESKWGFAPLIRSKGLMRGMRWVGLMLMMFFGFFEGVLIWVTVVAGKDDYSGFVSDDGWSTWGFVLRVVATSAVLTVLLLHSIAAITVLYMYCKALHGELAEEIVHEFASEYVSLPFDDKKVPHVVCYVH